MYVYTSRLRYFLNSWRPKVQTECMRMLHRVCVMKDHMECWDRKHCSLTILERYLAEAVSLSFVTPFGFLDTKALARRLALLTADAGCHTSATHMGVRETMSLLHLQDRNLNLAAFGIAPSRILAAGLPLALKGNSAMPSALL